ncbi:hypothetical protein IEQ11_23240 [Lysobacter capsici]|uniref:hypothetical protein n=1 Tax=Lysobacter capsici TaxID=435897 RepID=UPI0017862C9C|nr:hypothetical protein [Lysobacter capsici]UOF14597.1 hypothetical protein IEQ11_23240 [Lysobacter capsici]
MPEKIDMTANFDAVAMANTGPIHSQVERRPTRTMTGTAGRDAIGGIAQERNHLDLQGGSP